MKKKLQYELKVDQPCSQSWAAMQISECGRFCSECSKNVLDLSRLGDYEIIKILEKTDESICGRLLTSQLNRPLTTGESQKGHSILYNGLLAALLTTGIPDSAYSLQKEVECLNLEKPSSYSSRDFEDENIVDTVFNTIKGRVLDIAGFPVRGASVVFKGTTLFVTTDELGYFKLEVPKEYTSRVFSLTVSALEYETTTRLVSPGQATREISIFIMSADLKEGVVVGRVKVVRKGKKNSRKKSRS